MKSISILKYKLCLTLVLVLSVYINGMSQSIQQQEIQKLDFLIGNWIGTSKAFKNGKIKRQVPAFEKISFKVNEHILTIDLYSESLKLHTVIYYDDEAETYFYNPFYKTGTARYPAKLVNGKLIVNPSETKRFIFEITDKGQFREYGETFENGKWTMYFEDVFEKQ